MKKYESPARTPRQKSRMVKQREGMQGYGYGQMRMNGV